MRPRMCVRRCDLFLFNSDLMLLIVANSIQATGIFKGLCGGKIYNEYPKLFSRIDNDRFILESQIRSELESSFE
uniref:Uncharacterized protein n=1 Tax=Glossina palpalis gambiensis TaxID=67801 RepID=A0A1B0BJX0_9MUSC